MIQDCFRTTLLQQAKLCVACKNKVVVNTASHTLEHFESRDCTEQYSHFSPKEAALLCMPTSHYSNLRNKINNNNKNKLKKHNVEHYMRMTTNIPYKSVLNEGKKERV